jgi:hypothetical protein
VKHNVLTALQLYFKVVSFRCRPVKNGAMPSSHNTSLKSENHKGIKFLIVYRIKDIKFFFVYAGFCGEVRSPWEIRSIFLENWYRFRVAHCIHNTIRREHMMVATSSIKEIPLSLHTISIEDELGQVTPWIYRS